MTSNGRGSFANWTEDELEAAHGMHVAGMSYADIAARTGRTVPALTNRLYRYRATTDAEHAVRTATDRADDAKFIAALRQGKDRP